MCTTRSRTTTGSAQKLYLTPARRVKGTERYGVARQGLARARFIVSLHPTHPFSRVGRHGAPKPAIGGEPLLAVPVQRERPLFRLIGGGPRRGWRLRLGPQQRQAPEQQGHQSVARRPVIR